MSDKNVQSIFIGKHNDFNDFVILQIQNSTICSQFVGDFVSVICAFCF